ncbi:MAG TPA: serine hydrolase domain-containing protein [Candidatus Nanopelagicales bacterium]|nr:serine hydrolase domain-containing protein [Candidatus Nanopelagicales bacterium]
MTTAPIDDALLAEIDRLAGRELADRGLPGLAVALTGPDGPAEVRTYGLADLAARRPVVPETLFEIGSIGKTFTAIATLQLVEEGRLDLDAPVVDALPWFRAPVVGRPITIHDLLTHTAGITVGIDATPEAASQVWALRDRRPGSAPGERFHYSNLGYKTLGLVIETLEGRPYPEVIRTRILEPLGMTATEPAITNAIRSRLAVGYDYLHDDRIGYPGRPLVPATWVETATADGSIASTAGDMAAFARMILRRGEGPDGRLLAEASFARMAEPHARPSPDYGYGYALATRVLGGRSFLGHGGGMIGYLAALQVDPAAELAAVVLQNGLMGSPMALARAILAAARGPGEGGGDAPGGGSALADDGAEPDRAGVYRADPDDRDTDPLEITAGPDGPILRRRGRQLVLEALGDGRFLAPDPDLDRYALRFEPAGERPVVAWHGPTRYVRDAAAAPPLPDPEPAVAALAGHYRSHDPWVTNFRVVLRGDVPWLVFPAAPDGFEDEQPLVLRADGSLRVGDDPAGPEDLRFDTLVDGRPLRAWLSGFPYYRVG